MPFSSSNYWGEVEYGTFIYDSNSYLYSYVESYEAYLQSLGWSSASATLISYDQLRALGCSEGYCDNAPEWVYSSLYWTGSARGTVSTNSVYTVGAMRLQHYRGSCATCSMNMSNFGWDFHPGIRPVITVNISDIS